MRTMCTKFKCCEPFKGLEGLYSQPSAGMSIFWCSFIFLFLIKCTFLSISRVAGKNPVETLTSPSLLSLSKALNTQWNCGTAQWSTDQSLFVLDSLQEWHCASVISNISKKHTLTISSNYLKKLNIKIKKKCTLTCRNKCPYISLTSRVSVASLFHFNLFLRYKEK